MKILLVDDNQTNLYILVSLLRGNGYEVEYALDGIEALGKARQEDFDLIISDILMPRMDGFQLCREVKSDTRLRLIPFVFYTATYTDAKDEAFGLSLGAEKLIVKPQEPEVFVEIVRAVIAAHEAGHVPPSEPPAEAEAVFLKEYNERLISKLEDKMVELEDTNKTLRQSERKFRALVEQIPAITYTAALDETGSTSFISPQIEAMLGFSSDEWLADPALWSKQLHPEDRDRVLEEYVRAYSSRHPFRSEYRLLTRDGRVVWFRDEAMAVRDDDGRPLFFQGVMLDLTTRKQAEEQLQEATDRLQVLSRRILEVQEQERRRLAYELHDEIGQLWTAIKLNLEAAIQFNDLEAVHGFCREASRVADQAIQRARALSVDLRPSVLDDFGLSSALRWYLDRQRQQAGLNIVLKTDPAIGRLPQTIEITGFRIVQEAVTNIIRHARAHTVTVEVGRLENDLQVTITDDGVGFDVETAKKRVTLGESLGLLSMLERALLVGGSAEINSTPGRGTEILLRLPLGEK
jgi:two-component system sensor histidine kinase UhpB